MSIGLTLNAQTNYQDVIYLKNGSVIKGMIIEFVPNTSYTIKTADGSLFVCKIEDIVKITKEEVAGTKSDAGKSTKTDAYEFKPGYRGVLEGGFAAKSGKYGLNVTSFNFVNGYQLSEQMYVGLGTGFRYFNDADFTLIPLFADFKYAFLNQKISPIVGLGAGYTFNPDNGFQGEGFLFNPSLGVQYRLGKKMRLNLSLNYQTTQMNFLQVSNDLKYTYNIIRFSESAGFILGLCF
jgi:hypothetical protein